MFIITRRGAVGKLPHLVGELHNASMIEVWNPLEVLCTQEQNELQAEINSTLRTRGYLVIFMEKKKKEKRKSCCYFLFLRQMLLFWPFKIPRSFIETYTIKDKQPTSRFSIQRYLDLRWENTLLLQDNGPTMSIF